MNTFVIAPVKDREDKIRYLLNFAGIRSISYYVGLFLADFLLYGITISILMLMSKLLGLGAFNEHAGAIYGILMCFGYPLITFVYLGSFLFSKNETAFKYIILLP